MHTRERKLYTLCTLKRLHYLNWDQVTVRTGQALPPIRTGRKLSQQSQANPALKSIVVRAIMVIYAAFVQPRPFQYRIVNSV